MSIASGNEVCPVVLGVGTDILSIDRIRKGSYNMTDAFMRKTYTEKERRQALERDDPTLYFATRFAGKEAVFKSLHISGKEGSFCEIEILGDTTGRPTVALSGKIQELALEKGIDQVLISLSYETDYAAAFALAQSAKPLAQKE